MPSIDLKSAAYSFRTAINVGLIPTWNAVSAEGVSPLFIITLFHVLTLEVYSFIRQLNSFMLSQL